MISIAMIQATLREVKVGDFRFYVGIEGGGRVWVQVRFDAPCEKTGKVEEQHGRKFFLSEHMTKSELVRTCFMASLAVVEHELREQFKYRGRAVFGPHIDVDALHDAAVKEDRRDDQHVPD